MKVDTKEVCRPWADSLSIRIQVPPPSDDNRHIDAAKHDDDVFDEPLHFSQFSGKCFTRVTSESFMALRKMSEVDPLVLFTPYLVPAGLGKSAADRSQDRDPFEILGQRLAKHHANICHVPYVASIGFTQTHLDFVMDSDSVIVVVCEPDHPLKKVSIGEQHDFAAAALRAFESKEKHSVQGQEFVLVQCAAGQSRKRAKGFRNVIETESYDEDTAIHLADTILGRV